MRVLVLSHHLHHPETREKYRAIAAHGLSLVVLSPDEHGITDGGVRYLPIPAKRDGGEAFEFTGKSLKRVLSDERPDLLHIEADPESGLAQTGARVARSAKCPYVIHGQRAIQSQLGWLVRRRGAEVLRGSAGVLGESRMAMDLLRHGATNAIAATLPIGATSLPPGSGVRSGELVIGFAGRLVPERGADILVRALAQTYGHWQLLLVGTGPEQERLELEVQRRGLAARVEWRGGLRRETLDLLWPEIDCLVVPSRDTPTWVEYHSPVLLEAMSRGVTPVVSRAGCLPDVVGDAGVIVDGIDGLADILQQWVANPAVCRALGGRARARVMERFIPSAVAADTITFWREVLDHAATAPGRRAKGA